MRQWLSAADVFVSASRVEGMPVAPLEAMACGLPVVGTDAQGMGDIVLGGAEPCGIIVPRVDDTALAAAIDAVFGDPMLRERLSLAARHRVESHFSVTMVGQALATFLRSGS
jgi:starch synthase